MYVSSLNKDFIIIIIISIFKDDNLKCLAGSYLCTMSLHGLIVTQCVLQERHKGCICFKVCRIICSTCTTHVQWLSGGDAVKFLLTFPSHQRRPMV